MNCLRHAAKLLLLSAFVLRALVPAGLMPAALNDGSLFKLCPEGLSNAALAVLLGEHAHHQHGAAEHAGAAATDCQLGGGLCATLATRACTHALASATFAPTVAECPAALRVSPRRGDSQPRAPPGQLS